MTSEGDRVQLSGPLTLETVKALYDSGLQPGGKQAVVVDFSRVEAVDSAAVSLMLAWVREAQRKNLELSFSHVPDNLLSLARLYGVAELLPLREDAAARP